MTDKQHDFKYIVELDYLDCEGWCVFKDFGEYANFVCSCDTHQDAKEIQTALRIADRLQKGEIKKQIISDLLKDDVEHARAHGFKGQDWEFSFNKASGVIEFWVNRVFKATSKQLIKEESE